VLDPAHARAPYIIAHKSTMVDIIHILASDTISTSPALVSRRVELRLSSNIVDSALRCRLDHKVLASSLGSSGPKKLPVEFMRPLVSVHK
jgi:hypothetical protein